MRIIPFLIFFLSFFVGNAQIMKLDFDSVYVICKYKDFKKRIKKDNHSANIKHKLRDIDSLKKIRPDTILIGRQLIFNYHREADDLVKANKVSFFDQRTNKKVARIEKIKEGKKGEIYYYHYFDADTKKELYEILNRPGKNFIDPIR